MIRRLRSLPLQLFLLTVLPLTIALLAVAFASAALHQRAMRTLVGERDERAARAAAAAIAEQLQHRAAAVSSLATQASGLADPAQALLDAAPFLPEFDEGLALFSPDGRLLAASSDPEKWGAWAVPALITAMENAGTVVGNTTYLPTFTLSDSHPPVMFIATTTADDLLAVGAFHPATLSSRVLADIFDAGDRAAAFLVNRDGLLLYQIGRLAWDPATLKQHPGVVSALRGEGGTTYVDVNQSEHVIAFSPILPVGWALVIEEPWQAVTDPFLRTTELAPLALAPALIVALAGLWFGVRQVIQPLQSLEQKAHRLAWGDFKALSEPVGGVDEVRHLQEELVHMARKVEAAQAGLRGYLGAVTAGQEEERRRLARELHDDTVQALIALNQRVQLAQMASEDRSSAAQLEEVQQMVSQLIADMRRLTRGLRPIYLEDLGLVPALDMLTRDTSGSLDLPITFRHSGEARRLSPAVELALYRMAQEALSNVGRHAQASQASVRLAFEQGQVSLTISDDGRGFEVPDSPAALAPSGHFGLLGLHERAELVGARLFIHSMPNEGTRIRVVVPA